jgi:hypothetical protein
MGEVQEIINYLTKPPARCATRTHQRISLSRRTTQHELSRSAVRPRFDGGRRRRPRPDRIQPAKRTSEKFLAAIGRRTHTVRYSGARSGGVDGFFWVNVWLAHGEADVGWDARLRRRQAQAPAPALAASGITWSGTLYKVRWYPFFRLNKTMEIVWGLGAWLGLMD